MIDDNVTIFPNSYIISSFIGKGSKIYSSLIEKSSIEKCVYVGPFSHLKFTNVDSNTKIGAFSELKNCKISKNEVIISGTIMKNNEIVKLKDD